MKAKRVVKSRRDRAQRGSKARAPFLLGVLVLAAIGLVYGFVWQDGSSGAKGQQEQLDWHIGRAQLFWASGDRDNALQELRQVAVGQPGNIEARLGRAKVLFSLGEISQATREFEEVKRLQPGHSLAQRYLKAAAILLEQEADQTLAHLGKTQTGNPAEAYNNIGLYYTRLGIQLAQPDFFYLAIDALETALELEPQQFTILANLANAYFELGELDAAAQSYQKIIQVMPDRAEPHFNLGLVYENQRKYGLAAQHYQQAAVLNPAWALPKSRLQGLPGEPSVPTEPPRLSVKAAH